MVREIVVHGDATARAAHFQPPLDAAELRQGFKCDGWRNASMARSSDRSQCIAAVVHTCLRQVQTPDVLRTERNIERMARSLVDRSRVPGVGNVKTFHL